MRGVKKEIRFDQHANDSFVEVYPLTWLWHPG